MLIDFVLLVECVHVYVNPPKALFLGRSQHVTWNTGLVGKGLRGSALQKMWFVSPLPPLLSDH